MKWNRVIDTTTQLYKINVLYNLGKGGQICPLIYFLIFFPFNVINENAFGGSVIQSLFMSKLCLSKTARQFLFAQKSLLKSFLLALWVKSEIRETSVHRSNSSSRFFTWGRNTISTFGQNFLTWLILFRSCWVTGTSVSKTKTTFVSGRIDIRIDLGIIFCIRLNWLIVKSSWTLE